MKLVTNNPKFKSKEMRNIEVEFLDINYIDILKKARDYIYADWELLTHPLYGSVKPNETIYRSILLKKERQLDLNSANLISEAIQTFEKFQNNKKTPRWTVEVKEDFSIIDFDLINNAIKRIIQ